jgi:hypothetical protein
MTANAKSEQLQVRVTPQQKDALRFLAERAGVDVSTYVLSRALPRLELEFNAFVDQLRSPELKKYAWAELNDLLTDVSAEDFGVVCAEPWTLRSLDERMQNYVAAMVEEAAGHLGVAPPPWTAEVEPLSEPWFASDFKSLRPYLLMASPVPYRRRNIFIESALGTRAATGARARERVPGFRGGEGEVRYASKGVVLTRAARIAERGRTWGDRPGLITRDRIEHLLRELDAELGTRGATGELYLVGGAVMCLAFGAREATRDVDGAFRPEVVVRAAAEAVARREGVDADWLNDAVKGFLSERGGYDPWLDLPHLRVFVAQPQYLLAMKCLAMRPEELSPDWDDIRFLARYLDVRTAAAALAIVERYYDEPMVKLRTRLALEEMFGVSGA